MNAIQEKAVISYAQEHASEFAQASEINTLALTQAVIEEFNLEDEDEQLFALEHVSSVARNYDADSPIEKLRQQIRIARQHDMGLIEEYNAKYGEYKNYTEVLDVCKRSELVNEMIRLGFNKESYTKKSIVTLLDLLKTRESMRLGLRPLSEKMYQSASNLTRLEQQLNHMLYCE